MDATDWPFDDPKNLAVITTKRIVNGEAPILLVFRDAEEGDWQFLDGEEFYDDGNFVEGAAVVGLHTITRIDPSLLSLADLPLGWEAWRVTKDGPWQRRPAP
jgi:hypothetical protein